MPYKQERREYYIKCFAGEWYVLSGVDPTENIIKVIGVKFVT
jgi:hypothetical protein